MTTTSQIDAFLACKRIGFAGVSTNPRDFSRTVFREFVAHGYDVVPIHPTAEAIDGRTAYPSIVEAPELEATFIMTPPGQTESIVVDSHRAGIERVWMHRRAGLGSVDWHAVQYAKAFSMDVVEGECPLMFLGSPGVVDRARGYLRRMSGHYPAADETPPSPVRTWRAIGYGTVAWALATWLMLMIGGMFGWEAGLATRIVVVPIAFGVLAWLQVEPGRLSPLAAAVWLVATGLVLDAVVLWLFVERDIWLVGDLRMSVLPYALAFVTAIVVGTHHERPFVHHYAPLSPSGARG